jgi:hypothetical protein
MNRNPIVEKKQKEIRNPCGFSMVKNFKGCTFALSF